jgi:hypothetical protein
MTFVAMCITMHGSSAAIAGDVEKAIFRNGYGEEITLTNRGAVISGKIYPATSCSTGSMKCLKYGASFAIMTPLTCATTYPYDWHASGIRSVFMAATPHNPYRVLMSTTYGGMVAFVYEGKRGVTKLYYDPSILIGAKAVWHELGSFDSDMVQYDRVDDGDLFLCHKGA